MGNMNMLYANHLRGIGVIVINASGVMKRVSQ
jgi:hypothetical protein